MKKRLIPDEQHDHIIRVWEYLMSDQFWIDMLRDDPEGCEYDLHKAGYDPGAMTDKEKLEALNSIRESDLRGDA